MNAATPLRIGSRAVTDLTIGPPIYEGTRIPSPIPTILQVPEELRQTDDILTVNFGPNHPSTHGVLRLVVDLDGETVAGVRAVIGYLHTGFEKSMEQKTYWKAITYPARMDYLSFQQNELLFVMAMSHPRKPSGCARCSQSSSASTRTSSGSARRVSSSARSPCSGTASASAT
jgi:hypothetical protein